MSVQKDKDEEEGIYVASTSLYISEWLMRNNNEYSWVWALMVWWRALRL